MAVSSTLKKSVLAILVLSFMFSSSTNGQLLRICQFDHKYQLGDSISDTGNLIREVPTGAASVFARQPYGEMFFKNLTNSHGETFFKNSTGRASNGLLMIDYIVMDAGLPFLPPYRNSEAADFTHGVNFAVADCGEKLQKALFMVGEIGGSDYNSAADLKSMVPKVIDAIMFGVRKAISFGASRLVVPGILPIGCLPLCQTAFETNISTAYDENQCLKELNEFARHHNCQLEHAIYMMTAKERLDATVVYGDYYNAYQHLLQFAYGFETQGACCGIGGTYNVDSTRMCGAPDVPVCVNPHRYISWYGLHLTQESYMIMADWLVNDISNKLLCHSWSI